MKRFDETTFDELLKRAKQRRMRQSLALYPAVEAIISDVAERGDAALKEYSAKFDGISPETQRVPISRLMQAYEDIEPDFRAAMAMAIKNIRTFHDAQRLQGYALSQGDVDMGQIVQPLDRVGIYVPGGEAAYPSTLLMNVIPAQLAGVPEIAVFTPPQKDVAKLLPILAAAYAVGVTELYLVGGVQAVAAMAYGTESIKAVDKITGPGNQYVTAAKKLVFGDVGIDMIAGPSEVMIVSDGRQSPECIAADLLAQMEHDKEAMALVVTLSAEEAEAINVQLLAQIKALSKPTIAQAAYENNTFICTSKTLEQAMALVNQLAPEHLELLTEDPKSLLNGVRHAGAVFLGAYTPEALGDYVAGPNHTLPTTGSARFSSPLGTYDFQKRINYLNYTQAAFANAADAVMTFARKEQLEAHGKAIEKRLAKA